MTIKTLDEILAELGGSATPHPPADKQPSAGQNRQRYNHRQQHPHSQSPKTHLSTAQTTGDTASIAPHPHSNTSHSQKRSTDQSTEGQKRHAQKLTQKKATPLAATSNEATPPRAEPNPNASDYLQQILTLAPKTPEQREAERHALKADSRLRWLAFYYLSTREHSQAELKQKLLAKDQDPDKVDALLKEFAEKGYQSEERTAYMLIREGIRKGRGKVRIRHDLKQRQLQLEQGLNVDELINEAMAETGEFVEYSDEANAGMATDVGVDWLRLAVEARSKKYGDSIPTTAKEQARQLRFLQRRGFTMDICYQAIKYTEAGLDGR